MDHGQSQAGANSHSQVVLDLIALLDANREEIATAWARTIREQLHDSSYGQYPLEQISAYNLYGLGMIRHLLPGEDPEFSQTMYGIGDPGPTLVREGIPIHEVAEGAWLFQKTICSFLERWFGPGSPAMQEATSHMDRCARRLTLMVVERYGIYVKQRLREEQRRTELMLEMTRRAGSTLELGDVLAEAARGIADAAGAPHCLIYLLEEDGSTCTLGAVTDGLPPPVAEFARNALYRKVPLSDTSLIRLVAGERRLLSFNDAQSDDGAARKAGTLWGTRAMLAVPVMHKERLLAVAVGFTLEENRTLTNEQMELIAGLANAVAPAIDNARLYQKVEQLAVLEERSLLAQEIHDELAQTLCAMRFRASLTTDFLAGEQWTQVQDSLLALKDMIDTAYTEVREAIFNLRSIPSLGAGGLPALQGYLESYRQHYGLDVRLDADREAVDTLAGSTGVQVIRIIQEALSNVRKHGRTIQARVRIVRDSPWVRIEIEDDGQGFDPAGAPGEDSQHFGMQFMRERAAKAGGTLNVESRPGHGTRVVLSVPYDREGGPR